MADVRIRALALPQDGPGVGALDCGFTTTEAYDVTRTCEGFALRLSAREFLVKTYGVDDCLRPSSPWEVRLVAERAGRLVGVVAARCDEWNGRLVIGHLYVDRKARGGGVGRALLDAVLEHGLRRGALLARVETQNVNVPAIRADRALGFEVGGLDLSLYSGTEAQGEIAIYMARPLSGSDGAGRSRASR